MDTKDAWPTSPLEEDVNNWLDSPLPCPCYGLLCSCQVNAAYMLNAVTSREPSFTTTCKDVRQGKIRAWKSRKGGLCKNEANRETQKCSYIAAKRKQHLSTPLNGAPRALWVTATGFHDRNTLLLPLLPEPAASRKHHSLLDQQTKSPKASCTVHFCLAQTCGRATAAPASLGSATAFHDSEHSAHPRCQCWGWNTPGPAPLWRQAHTRLTALFVPLAATFNTDKGVQTIKKRLSCPSQCKERSKTIYL